MKKIINKGMFVTLGIVIIAIGASLCLKVAIGVGAWDALSQSVSSVINIKVGTFSMILNLSCVFIQYLLLKKEFKLNHMLQVGVSLLLGVVVNFMLYEVYTHFTINSYFMKMLLFVISILICGIGVSMVMATNVISLPLEGCCMVIAKRINKNFGFIRQMVDVISIGVALAVALFFENDITVREGTVLGMLAFGPMIDLLIKKFTPVMKKYNLVHEEEDTVEMGVNG